MEQYQGRRLLATGALNLWLNGQRGGWREGDWAPTRVGISGQCRRRVEGKTPMTKLSELDPKIGPSPAGDHAQRLTFLCPLCRKFRISVDIWHGRPTQVSRRDG